MRKISRRSKPAAPVAAPVAPATTATNAAEAPAEVTSVMADESANLDTAPAEDQEPVKATTKRTAKAPGKAAAKSKAATEAEAEPAVPAVVDLPTLGAELAELAQLIQYERTIRCLPGEDFPLDTATGRLIRADIDQVLAAGDTFAGPQEVVDHLVQLRDVCRRLLSEVRFGDAPGRREPAGRTAARAARPRPPREYYPCLDGSTPPEPGLLGTPGPPVGMLAAVLSAA